MGEVYRARDPRVQRDVAIKVLPEVLARDPDRLQRFQREAQALASLNHPNIALLYGVEDVDGIRGLVLELVEGPTLAELIAHAARPAGRPSRASVISIDELLAIARQIADALEAAHEHGLVHRDLKPGNIKVTPAGVTKLLDFGLAKAFSEDAKSGNIVNSPTVTSIGTRAGVILGTAAYMSPEQARGRPVDKRTDIWAFGCVLYEMLTGRAAFAGEDVTDVLVRIIEREPDFTALPADTPPALLRLLRRCLVKDRRHRLSDIADARLELDEALTPSLAGAGSGTGGTGRRSSGWLLPAILGLVVGAAGGSLAVWSLTRPAPARPMRVVIAPPPSDPLYSESIGSQVTISPDGTQVVYVGIRGGPQLYARKIDQLEAQPIPGTLGARQPFFSPDGTSIGFWSTAESELRRVAVGGGPVVTICKAPTGNLYGAAWGEDGKIIFGSGGLYRVSAAGGGSPEVLTTPAGDRGEVEHRWPEILPGGTTIVFTVWSGSIDRSRVVIRPLAGGETRTLFESASSARYAATGHLVYYQSGSVMATTFDPVRMAVGDRRVAVQENVKTTVSGATDFGIARDGTFVFIPGAVRPERRLVWVDRQGRSEPLLPAPDDYWVPRLSPDGSRLAVGVGPDLYAIELKRLTRDRVTFGTTNTLFPYAWSDSRRILFSKVENKVGLDIYSTLADGSGTPELLLKGDNRQWATSVAPDGTVALYEQHPTTLRDIWLLGPDRTRRRFLATPYQERVARYSPNGRWIVYVSNDSGRDEVYVRPASGAGGKVTISHDGGTEPVWAADGREVFYRHGLRLYSAAVVAEQTFEAQPARVVFEGAYELDRGSGAATANYDVTRDGRRFVMIQAPTASTNIVVVLNWFAELRARFDAATR
jgi:serine/threonine-protein kinase